jgi:hypothetical protein
MIRTGTWQQATMVALLELFRWRANIQLGANDGNVPMVAKRELDAIWEAETERVFGIKSEC